MQFVQVLQLLISPIRKEDIVLPIIIHWIYKHACSKISSPGTLWIRLFIAGIQINGIVINGGQLDGWFILVNEAESSVTTGKHIPECWGVAFPVKHCTVILQTTNKMNGACIGMQGAGIVLKGTIAIGRFKENHIGIWRAGGAGSKYTPICSDKHVDIASRFEGDGVNVGMHIVICTVAIHLRPVRHFCPTGSTVDSSVGVQSANPDNIRVDRADSNNKGMPGQGGKS